MVAMLRYDSLMTTSGVRPAATARRPAQINDLDLANWQQYDDILTDSLWVLDARDSSGAHQADYHGNFIPQIPRQMLRRFTKAGDAVLDPFVGSGTTAIEAARLGRGCVGVELSPQVARIARERIRQDELALDGALALRPPAPPAPPDDDCGIIVGDSSAPDTRSAIAERLDALGKSSVQMLIMHPPYHNIIQFSDHPLDLSNCPNVGHFIRRFLEVYRNVGRFLDAGRHLAVVLGDIYANAEWLPLQNLVTSALLNTGELRLKSIIVKNMVNNRAKRNQEHLWRYRALANGFYIFKHEYVALFQKATAPPSAWEGVNGR